MKYFLTIFSLILILFSSSFKHKKKKIKAENKAIIHSTTIKGVRTIYHDNGFTKEDSDRIYTSLEKIKIEDMLFYQTNKQPSSIIVDSIYNSGYRANDEEYRARYLERSRKIIEERKKKK